MTTMAAMVEKIHCFSPEPVDRFPRDSVCSNGDSSPSQFVQMRRIQHAAREMFCIHVSSFFLHTIEDNFGKQYEHKIKEPSILLE